jgi:hypothetical protein
MQLRWTGLLAGALIAGAAGTAVAQQGVALTPYIGYMTPLSGGVLVEQNSPGSGGCCLELTAKGGIMVGGIGELTLAKSLSISAFAASTIGLTQKSTFDFSTSGGSNLELGMAVTQFGGTLRLLPMGRAPNGAPKGFFVEGGAAYNVLSFSDVADRSGGSTPSPSWNSSSVVGIAGAGLVFRVGPRASLTIFARYHMALKEYSSDGLTAWNSVPPPDTPKKVNWLFIGAGLRTGR